MTTREGEAPAEPSERPGDKRFLTTQLYVKGEERNEKDPIFRRIDPALRETVLVDFFPIKGSGIGELGAKFDIVAGRTPEDREEDRPRVGGQRADRGPRRERL